MIKGMKAMINFSFERGNDGFTLAEMVVAMTVFVIVIVAVMGLFIRSIQTERGVAGTGSTVSSVSLAMEEISREMRTASSFTVPQSSDGGVLLTTLTPQCMISYPSITFTYVNGFGTDTTVSYNLEKNSATGNNQIMQTITGSQPLPMTPAGTNISNLQFIVSNQCPSTAGGQVFSPRITVAVSGSNPSNEPFGFISKFNLETTISQRLYYYLQ
ncbi:MAG: prepilin-type N-terminal cleavage/methylation domain-containing protein [Patescibacteria group bacterium]|nr:prepilin-type N-terminal cleavage/methylation domain-containing protein [Patescibacteria group bacterium]